MNTEEEMGEDFSIDDLPRLQSHAVPAPAFTEYTTDSEFRAKHPLALRALCGGVELPRGVRPYGLVAVENPLKRPWVYEHNTGLPPDAFPITGAPCRYRPEHLQLRFRWEPGETKLVPALILGGLWQIRDGEIVGGGGTELRLAKGEMPPLSAAGQHVKEAQDRLEKERGASRRVRP